MQEFELPLLITAGAVLLHEAVAMVANNRKGLPEELVMRIESLFAGLKRTALSTKN